MEDLTAIKRMKVQMDINTGMQQTNGTELVSKKNGKVNAMGKEMLKGEVCSNYQNKKK